MVTKVTESSRAPSFMPVMRNWERRRVGLEEKDSLVVNIVRREVAHRTFGEVCMFPLNPSVISKEYLSFGLNVVKYVVKSLFQSR